MRSRNKEKKPSKVHNGVIPGTKKETLQGMVKGNVNEGANIYTDSYTSYQGLSPEFVHEFVDHAVCYAKGAVRTTGLESYFSLLKRTLKGTYLCGGRSLPSTGLH